MRNNFRISKELAGIAMLLASVIGFGAVKASLRPSVSVNKVLISNSLCSSILTANSNLLTSKLPDRTRAQVQEAYGKIPLIFEANQGQADQKSKFLSRGSGFGVFLTSTGAVLQLPISDYRQRTEEPVLAAADFRFLINRPSSPIGKSSAVNHSATQLSMKLLGAGPRSTDGQEPLPDRSGPKEVAGFATDSSFDFLISSGEQRIIPNIVQYLRDYGSAPIGPVGPAYVGALSARVDGGAKGAFIGARTSTPGGGGRYGLFYVAGSSSGWAVSTWLNGLQQNSESRTNLALVNTGSGNGSTDSFNIELFDGNTGLKVNVVEGIALKAGHWLQIGTILSKYAPGVTQGYAEVTRARGSNPFIAYAVINDGSQAGERSGDGAFILSSP